LYSINSIGMRVKSPTRLVLCLVWWLGNHSVSGCFPLCCNFRICTLPKDLKWSNILGAGMLVSGLPCLFS
jgi:hypothetical protein